VAASRLGVSHRSRQPEGRCDRDNRGHPCGARGEKRDFDGFTEGFDTPDLKEAKALLDELTSTATKAAAPARRHGRPPTTTTKAAGRKRSSSNLGDQILALATSTAAAASGRAVRPDGNPPLQEEKSCAAGLEGVWAPAAEN
jgi:hypothetical protein